MYYLKRRHRESSVATVYYRTYNPTGHRTSKFLESKGVAVIIRRRDLYAAKPAVHQLRQSYKVISMSACSFCKIAVAWRLHESLACVGKRRDVRIGNLSP